MRTRIITAVAAAALAVVAAGCGASIEASTGSSSPPPSATAAPPTSASPTHAAPHYTVAQQQAIGSAEGYLSTQAFSRKGLIKQLSSQFGEGFSRKVAVFAVNHIRVNWNQEAVKSAKQYLSSGEHFSRAGLIEQLSSPYGEQFTLAQATYAANHVGL